MSKLILVLFLLHNPESTKNMKDSEGKVGVIRNSQTVPYLQLVGYKEDRLAFGDTPDGFMEDMGTNTSIDGAEGVIQEKYGLLAVEGTSQAHPLTLPSTQVGTSLSNLAN